MTPPEPGPTGRFVKKSIVHPAIEVDCSTWGADAAGTPWTTGRFVKRSQVHPAVAVDCSAWPETPTLCLELTLQPGPAVDPVQLGLGLFDVLNAVNKLERALGGTGLTKVAGQQSNGTVTLILAPEQQAGAADRILQICEQLNRANQSTAELPLPAAVKAIKARVA
jgi:hypothetical protein